MASVINAAPIKITYMIADSISKNDSSIRASHAQVNVDFIFFQVLALNDKQFFSFLFVQSPEIHVGLSGCSIEYNDPRTFAKNSIEVQFVSFRINAVSYWCMAHLAYWTVGVEKFLANFNLKHETLLENLNPLWGLLVST